MGKIQKSQDFPKPLLGLKTIKISIFNYQKNLPIQLSQIRRLVHCILQAKEISCEEISLYFVGKKKIATLHHHHFQDSTVTDCMSFPIDDTFLGELVVCPQVARERNPSYPYRELTLYIIHCLLHLIGYRDDTAQDRKKMKQEERKLMRFAEKNQCLLRPFP